MVHVMNSRAPKGPWLLALVSLGLGGACSEGNTPADEGDAGEGSGGDTTLDGSATGGADPGTGGTNSGGGQDATGGTGESPSGGSASGGTGAGGASTGGQPADGGSGGGFGENGWTLVWFDEFDGSAIDAEKWEHEVDCWGGGNGEDQCYVADAKNSFSSDGVLHIVALDDDPSGPEGGGSGNDGIVSKGHSSARLRTKGKADFTYGRVEARLKLPFGQGIWPAFWMLPSDETYGGWAASGEIDIMEAVNLNPTNEVFGTLHYGGAWPENTSTGDSMTPADSAWENFHVYAVEWEEGEVRWFVDDEHYQTQNDWFSASAAYPAPFDQAFHIVLNVAVGGSWPGPPDDSTTFPQEMQVDYVRVFSCSIDPETGHGCGTSDPNVAPL